MKDSSKIQLYAFKDFDMEDFKKRYLKAVLPHVEYEPVCIGKPKTIEVQGVKSAAKREYLIEDKCLYLQDAVIRRGNSKKDSKTFSMNAQILQAVIGKEYKVMLRTLVDMGYLELGDGKYGTGKYWYYYNDEYSTLYSLTDKEFELSEPLFNARVKGYKDKTIEQIKKMTDKHISGYVSEDFMKRYIQSLKYVRIEDYEGLKAYIDASLKENPDASTYYDFVFAELENKERAIYRIDWSHRFYHILTNLDRNIKKFLSIDFMLDCKNSHPVLFNYFIFNKYNFSSSVSYSISKYFRGLDKEYISSLSFPFTSPSHKIYHNVSEYLYNSLIDNNIEISSVAKMSLDEVEYIYKTSNGLLWDEICQQHQDMDRSEVKAAMFGAVFYSKSPVSDRWNDYAKEFKKVYPSVFSLIADWKREKNQDEVMKYMQSHKLPYREKSSLSIAMMALESDIFTGILKHLYAKRWNACHIHDCIVIPKDANKNHPTIEQVKEIMADVYKSFGLCPTFD